MKDGIKEILQVLVDYLFEEEGRDFEYVFFEMADPPETNVSVGRLEERALEPEYAEHIFSSVVKAKRWLEEHKTPKCTCWDSVVCPIHNAKKLMEQASGSPHLRPARAQVGMEVRRIADDEG